MEDKPKVVKDSAFYAKIGKIGGNRTKQKMLKQNPNYYSENGAKGGNFVKKSRGGKQYYSAIGQKSWVTRREKMGIERVRQEFAKRKQEYFDKQRQLADEEAKAYFDRYFSQEDPHESSLKS